MTDPVAQVESVIDRVLGVESRVADFIANGPSTGLAGYVRDGYRTRCRQWANAPAWARALSSAPAGSLGRICEPYLDNNGWDSPTSQPPFTGGQCAGTTYQITCTTTVFANGLCSPTTNPFSTTAIGPITGPFTDSVTPPPGGPLCPSTSGTRVYLRVGPSQSILTLAGASFGARVSGLSVTPVSGPDNCGSQPPVLTPGPNPPPNPAPLPGPEPTDDPSNPTGPPLLPIPPYNDPVGGPTPIVGPTTTPEPFDPTAIPGDGDRSTGGPENVGPAIPVNPGPGGGGEQTNLGEPPVGKVWIGAYVQFDIPESYGNIAGSAPAAPVVPRVVGNASLVFDGARDTPVQVRSGNVVLIRPAGSLKVTGVYVNCEGGITYTVRGLSAEKCPPNECIED